MWISELSTLFLALVQSTKGTEVASWNCTGGRQILLSNRVLERAFFGEEPRELYLGASLRSQLGAREEIKSSFLAGPPPAQKTPQPPDTNWGRWGGCENRKSPLPCRKAVSDANRGKCWAGDYRDLTSGCGLWAPHLHSLGGCWGQRAYHETREMGHALLAWGPGGRQGSACCPQCCWRERIGLVWVLWYLIQEMHFLPDFFSYVGHHLNTLLTLIWATFWFCSDS